MTYFTINDLETFSGIRKHTIRIWEQRYSFLQPKRSGTLRRVYTPEELTILLNVARLNQGGLRVSRIAKMVEEKKQTYLLDLANQQVKAIHDLIIAMAEMDVVTFDNVLQQSIERWGLDETLNEVIIPFCERVGLFQKQDNRTYLDNVLLVTEPIKQKLYSAIEQVKPAKSSHKTILLFLLKGEQQELPLLYIHYLLKREGYQVCSLGNNISIESITTICKYKKPDILITSQLEKSPRMELLQLVKQLPKYVPQAHLITIGIAIPKASNLTYYKHSDTPKEVAQLIDA